MRRQGSDKLLESDVLTAVDFGERRKQAIFLVCREREAVIGPPSDYSDLRALGQSHAFKKDFSVYDGSDGDLHG